MHFFRYCPAQPRRSRGGFTLIELVLVILMLLVLAAVLFPVFSKAREGRRPSCARNPKVIGLALLTYAQDNDETFPPRAYSDGGLYWGGGDDRSLLLPYLKNAGHFRCPEMPRSAHLTYMYNDLAAARGLRFFGRTERTVLVTDGENVTANVGHSYEPNAAPHGGAFNTLGRCDPGKGATVRDAPTRHSGGAWYLFADGHVKWFKPVAVFFPPRDSNGVAHRDAHGAHGPAPNGDMTWNGVTYKATFHIK